MLYTMGEFKYQKLKIVFAVMNQFVNKLPVY